MRNFLVTVDGRQYQVSVEEVKGGFPQPQPVQVPVAPAAPVAPVAPVQATPVQAPQQEAAPQPAPTATVQAPQDGYKYTAPMPGMIKKLSLSNGSQVKKGDVVLVLEAMKMDNDLTAPCDGVITYCVSEGANVDSGAVLAVIA